MKFSFSSPQTPISVSENQRRLSDWMEREGVDAVLVTAQNRFLSNTPLEDNQRYALTGFSGSAGDGIFLADRHRATLALSGPFVLALDGRYHLQGDAETRAEETHLLKLAMGQGMDFELFEILKHLPWGSCVAFDAARLSVSRFQSLQAFAHRRGYTLVPLSDRTLTTLAGLPGWSVDRAITEVEPSRTGRDLDRNASEIRERMRRWSGTDRSVHMTCAPEDAAWLLNARGFHLPFQSSVLAYTFQFQDEIVLFLPEESARCPIERARDERTRITVIRADLEELRKKLLEWWEVDRIFYRSKAMNSLLPEFVRTIWPEARHESEFEGLMKLRAGKTPEELATIREAFLRSSRAIARTLRWAKAETAQGHAPSEWDAAQKISREYEAEGAVALSFRTIAGAGPHSAVVHYGAQSKESLLEPGELFLLDSGAYYAEGYATDCTRVIFCGTREPSVWQKEIYSLVLKAWMTGLRGKIPKNLLGREWDNEIRRPLRERGYDFNHGTGHGIGIHVHEDGVGISPGASQGFAPGTITSIEPGIYLEGKGGVRIENVAITRASAVHPENAEFENLIWVGLDWALIDLNLFDEGEKAFLREYERRCAELGTQVTECPL